MRRAGVIRAALRSLALGSGLLSLVVSGCASGPDDEAVAPRSPSSREDRRVHTPDPPSAHPHDGEGHARLSPAEPVVCGSWGRWTVDWIAGPTGLEPGDAVVLQVSPFWGWTPPQTARPGFPGFTTVSAPPGVTLDVADGQVPMTVVARLGHGRLSAGDTLRFVYGDSTRGGAGSLSRADMYAERFEEFLVKTDGDGDGFFAPVADPPGLRVVAAPPVRLAVSAPAVVRPGERFPVRIHALDPRDNLAELPPGAPKLLLRALRDDSGDTVPVARELPGAWKRADRNDRPGGASVRVVVNRPGIYRLEASVADPALLGTSDLLLVDGDDTFAGLLWGDIHAHSSLSDGTGHPRDLYAYARDVSGLDVCVVTDHDAHGLAPLAGAPWDTVRAATAAFHDPGTFVTLLGYEWTSWTWGHRNVYYPGERGEVFSFADGGSDSPAELWERIAPFGGITIPHHPGGGPVPVDWSVPAPEERETVVEICSIHGSSEAPGVEHGIYRPVPGASVRDGLAAGHRLGILAAGDTHDGHPGRRTSGAPANGLAVFRGAERTRAGVLAAIRERRVYGTSGSRILLATHWGGELPGRTLPAAPAAPVTVLVTAPEPVEVVELIGPGGPLDHSWGGGRRCGHELRLPPESPAPAWCYVRVVLADGEVAWESPWWIGEVP